MNDLVVALDVGKTNLRVEVRKRGRCRLRVCQGVRGWMGAPGPRAALATQLAEVCARLPDTGSLTSAGAGIAGYDSAAAEEKDEVSRALRMALPRARVRVASDTRTAHLGAFRGRS
jgi:N-acetylglucosamine kinase-like BadF-type ATPase